MSILLSKATLGILAAAAAGMISLTVHACYVGTIRQGFWKRVAYAVALCVLVFPAVLSDWHSTWRSAHSVQHQHLYLLGLSVGFVAALAARVLEPIGWRIRYILISILSVVLVAFLTLAANTREVHSVRELVFHSATFTAAVFSLALITMIWRIAYAGEYRPDDGISRLLSRQEVLAVPPDKLLRRAGTPQERAGARRPQYPVVLLFLVVAAGCAQQTPKSTIEQQAMRIVTQARPSCTTGHEDAVSGGIVSIRPGETICINLEVKGQAVSISGVTSVESENTLVLAFQRESNPASMVLRVWNPFGSFLRYKANLLRPGASTYEYTTTCPVLSKRLAFEQWPHPIDALKLSSFELLSEDKNLTCQ